MDRLSKICQSVVRVKTCSVGTLLRRQSPVSFSRHRGNESLVVALRGECWSGKTSIKNLVLEHLAAQGADPMKVVGFNPWQWGTNDAITKAFIMEIARAEFGVQLAYFRLPSL